MHYKDRFINPYKIINLTALKIINLNNVGVILIYTSRCIRKLCSDEFRISKVQYILHLNRKIGFICNVLNIMSSLSHYRPPEVLVVIWYFPISSICPMAASLVLILRPPCQYTLKARFMGHTWGPPGADRTQVGPMLTPWTLLSVYIWMILINLLETSNFTTAYKTSKSRSNSCIYFIGCTVYCKLSPNQKKKTRTHTYFNADI